MGIGCTNFARSSRFFLYLFYIFIYSMTEVSAWLYLPVKASRFVRVKKTAVNGSFFSRLAGGRKRATSSASLAGCWLRYPGFSRSWLNHRQTLCIFIIFYASSTYRSFAKIVTHRSREQYRFLSHGYKSHTHKTRRKRNPYIPVYLCTKPIMMTTLFMYLFINFHIGSNRKLLAARMCSSLHIFQLFTFL